MEVPFEAVHRSVAGVTGTVLVALGALSFHEVVLLALVAAGLGFLVVAIVGRPTPTLSIPGEIAAVLLVAAVVTALVSLGAYLDPR